MSNTQIALKRLNFNISYDKLWALLAKLELKKKDLQERTKLSSAVIAKLGKNQSVQISTLAKICHALGCEFSDIVDFKKV